MFGLKNFRMGVNENGMHFQDSQTGVIFSVMEMTQGEHKIAICSKSARKKVRDELMEYLQEQYKGCLEFDDIPIEKVYIAPSLDFELYNFAYDSIGIKHKETGVLLAFCKVASSVAEVHFCFDHVYGHDGRLCKDFFDLCSPKIRAMETGRPNASVFISRTWSEKTIQDMVYGHLEKGIKKYFPYKDMSLYKDVHFYKEKNNITIKIGMDTAIRLHIYDVTDDETWITSLCSKTGLVIKFLYCLMAMQRYPQIKNIIFKFEDNDSNLRRIVIKRKERTKILREFVRIPNINLEF